MSGVQQSSLVEFYSYLGQGIKAEYKITMESEYSVENKLDYLVLKMTGVYNNQRFMSLAQDILDECTKNDVNRILVDSTEVDYTNMSTMERYFLGEEYAKVLSYKVKIAVVAPVAVITKFAENVATNRGANMLVEGDMKTAVAWLTSN